MYSTISAELPAQLDTLPARQCDREFQVIVAAQRDHDCTRIVSNIGCLNVNFSVCDNIDYFRTAWESLDCGLAIVSLGLWEQGVKKSFESSSRSLQGVRFALWVGNHSIEIDSIVSAIRLGAAAVLHGESCETRLQMLVRECQLETAKDKLANGESNTQTQLPTGVGAELLQAGSKRKNTQSSNGRHVPSKSIEMPGKSDSEYQLLAHSSGAGRCRPAAPIGQLNSSLAQLEHFILGNNAAIQSIRERILNVASTQATVMIFGESGTGKELVARAIHHFSDRSQQPFVPVNMSAIPEGLAESLLFGHEKGAFTSAHEKHQGWCQTAHGGTLFLDEIGDMELAVQPKLLRFLQEGTLQTIGAKSSSHVSVRLITATNRDPRLIVREGRLREDLFFRLHVVPIYIPPLRERRDDISLMAEFFLHRASERHGRNVIGLSSEAMHILSRFNWPGNVRQLENAIERVVIFAQGEIAQAMDIPAEFHAPARLWSDPESGEKLNLQNGFGYASVARSSEDLIGQLTPIQLNERTAIIDALQRTAGHVVDAAKLLGLGQATMYRKIKQYAVPNERRRRKTSPR